MISLKTRHIEITRINESIKTAQNMVKKYLKADSDIVEMLFDDRKKEKLHRAQ